MSEQDRPHSLFLVAAPGLEAWVGLELTELGLVGRIVPGGVSLQGNWSDLLRIQLWSAIATRALVRVGRFPAVQFHELERQARRIPWERFIRPGDLVQVRASCHRSRLYHSGAVRERLMDAIRLRVGSIRSAEAARTAPLSQGEEARPLDHACEGTSTLPEETEGATGQLVLARLVRDQVELSVDASGELLHRRGYRLATAKAPLRETLAAAMLRATGWTGLTALLDPCCGAGTIGVEAARLRRGLAPGLGRRFRMLDWPDCPPELWPTELTRAQEQARPRTSGAPILLSDRNAGAMAACQSNAARAGVEQELELCQQALEDRSLPPGPGWIMTNPPYGQRVGRPGPELVQLYTRLGQLARSRPGWQLGLLATDPQLVRRTGLNMTEVFSTQNGGLPVRCWATRGR